MVDLPHVRHCCAMWEPCRAFAPFGIFTAAFHTALSRPFFAWGKFSRELASAAAVQRRRLRHSGCVHACPVFEMPRNAENACTAKQPMWQRRTSPCPFLLCSLLASAMRLSLPRNCPMITIISLPEQQSDTLYTKCISRTFVYIQYKNVWGFDKGKSLGDVDNKLEKNVRAKENCVEKGSSTFPNPGTRIPHFAYYDCGS